MQLMLDTMTSISGVNGKILFGMINWKLLNIFLGNIRYAIKHFIGIVIKFM